MQAISMDIYQFRYLNALSQRLSMNFSIATLREGSCPDNQVRRPARNVQLGFQPLADHIQDA